MLLERYRKGSWCIHFEKNKVFSTRFSPVSSSFSHVDSKPSLVFGLFFHPDHFLIEFTCSLLCLTCSASLRVRWFVVTAAPTAQPSPAQLRPAQPGPLLHLSVPYSLPQPAARFCKSAHCYFGFEEGFLTSLCMSLRWICSVVFPLLWVSNWILRLSIWYKVIIVGDFNVYVDFDNSLNTACN